MPQATSYHETLRGLIAAALRTALTTAGVTLEGGVNEQESPGSPSMPSLPCVIVAYAGPETSDPITNAQDDRRYPLLVGLYTVHPQADPPGCKMSLFREVVWDTFNQQRLSGATDVWNCTVQGLTGPIDATLPGLQNLRTALIVTPVARRLRA